MNNTEATDQMTEDELQERDRLTKRVMDAITNKKQTMKELDKEAFLIACLSDLLLQVDRLRECLDSVIAWKVAEMVTPKEEFENMSVVIGKSSVDVSDDSSEDGGDQPGDNSVN